MPNLLSEKAVRAKLADASAVGFYELRKGDTAFPPVVKLGTKNCYVEDEVNDYVSGLIAKRNANVGG